MDNGVQSALESRGRFSATHQGSVSSQPSSPLSESGRFAILSPLSAGSSDLSFLCFFLALGPLVKLAGVARGPSGGAGGGLVPWLLEGRFPSRLSRSGLSL